MTKTLTLFTLTLLSFSVLAQTIKAPEYISLSKQRVYDVEIIVFAYNSALPNAQTYSNKELFDISRAYELDFKPADVPYIKEPDPQESNEQYTIDINSKGANTFALAWFEHENSHFKLTAIWEKLQRQASITPLIHRAWRQPATSFNSPQFVKLNTDNLPFDNLDNDLTAYPDKTVIGQVALSRGKYLHFGNQTNLFRSKNARDMIFSLTERKQIRSGELHYFDNPWFATLVKITTFKGK